MPDLTRETLAELRRLLEAVPVSFPVLTTAHDGDGLWEIVGLDDPDAHIASDLLPADALLIVGVLNNLSALLDAAERGLDVEGGR